jgi:hypothetical protein
MVRKIIILFLFSFVTLHGISQQIDSIKVPRRVVYKYCEPSLVQKACELVKNELTGAPTYNLHNSIVFIGPVLWNRYKKIPLLSNIEGGDVSIRFNNEILSAKLTQELTDFKKVWDYLRTEVAAGNLKLRKATYNELDYYWSVISFDIEEPLLIAETGTHRYILNISPKTMKLLWLDEAPESHR